MAIVFNGNIMNGRLQNNKSWISRFGAKITLDSILNNKQITLMGCFDSIMPENDGEIFTTADAIPRYLILGMYINR